jgi:hypothetical protein
MASVQEAIQKAREAAADAVVIDHEPSTAVAVAQAPAAPPMTFMAPSMETMAVNSGISKMVETWIKVSEFGINIGADRQPLFSELKVKILMAENDGFFVKHTIKTRAGEYYSCYDGTTCDKGGLFSDAVSRVQRMEPDQKVYASADIIFVLAEDVKLKDKTLPAGTKLGHTTSMSNWQNWAEFYRDVAKAGQLGQEIDAVVGFDTVTSKKNGKTWGVLNFKVA